MPHEFETLLTSLRDAIVDFAPDVISGPLEGLAPELLLGLLILALAAFIWSGFAAFKAVFGRDHVIEDEVAENAQDGPAFTIVSGPPPAAMERPKLREVVFEPKLETPPAALISEQSLLQDFEAAVAHGDHAATQSDPQTALEMYRKALTHARGLALPHPDDTVAQRRVAKALLKSGDASARCGDAAGARHAHEQSMVLLRRLFASNSTDPALSREYAVTLERVGAAAATAGDKVSARQAFEEELRVVGSIEHHYPNDPQWARFRAVIHVMLGNLGEYDNRAHYEAARGLFDTLERNGSIQPEDLRTLTQLRSLLSAA